MEQERKRLEQEREVDRRREEKRAKRNLKVTRLTMTTKQTNTPTISLPKSMKNWNLIFQNRVR